MRNSRNDLFPVTLRIFLAAAIIGSVAFMGWVAATIQIDYYDTFHILWNARSIATGDHRMYDEWRSPFLPILMAPIAFMEDRMEVAGLLLKAGHFLGYLSFLTLLILVYRFLRKIVSLDAALFAVLLLCCNPIALSVAPMGKEDLPGTVFTLALFLSYIHHPEKKIRLAVLLTGAIATRYHLIPVLAAVLITHEIISRRRVDPRFIFWTAVAPVAFLVLVLPVMLYPAIGLSEPLAAPDKFLDALIAQHRAGSRFESPILNVFFLAESFSVPVLVLAGTGVLRKSPHRPLMALWFLFFFLVQTFVIGHKEARYLLPLYPPLAYFIALGAELLWRFRSKILVLLVLILPVANGIRAHYRFLDPVYHLPFAQQLAAYAKSMAGEHAVLWRGPPYALAPRDHVFRPEDPFTYTYHLYGHVISYYIDQRTVSITAPTVPQPGDVVITNSGSFETTRTLSRVKPPLTLDVVR